MEKVYITFGYANESECRSPTTEVLGVFRSEESAKAAIEKAATHLARPDVKVSRGPDWILGDVGDWHYEYYYKEFEMEE